MEKTTKKNSKKARKMVALRLPVVQAKQLDILATQLQCSQADIVAALVKSYFNVVQKNDTGRKMKSEVETALGLDTQTDKNRAETAEWVGIALKEWQNGTADL